MSLGSVDSHTKKQNTANVQPTNAIDKEGVSIKMNNFNSKKLHILWTHLT
jgi:Leucine-rich repeat (LRR) protein